MKRPVQRGNPAGGIGHHAVFLKAADGVVVRRLEGDIDAPAEVIRDRRTVAVQAGDHLDLTSMMQRAGIAGTQHVGQFVRAAGREGQAIRWRRQASGIGDRRHLDAGLRAVKERIEHLRIHPPDARLLRGQAVIGPDGVGGGGVVFRQIFRALAGGDDAEPAGARPVHQLADQRRLVAVGHAVHDAGRLRLARQQGASEDVGLHVDHDDVLALGDCASGMRDAGRGVAGGFDRDVDVGGCEHRHGVVGETGGGDALLGPADAAAGVAGLVGKQVGDGGDGQAGCGRHLRQEHRAELARADQADADGAFPLLQQAKQVHGAGSFPCLDVRSASVLP